MTLIIGGFLAIAGFICTQYWVDWVYPVIARDPDTLNSVSNAFAILSRPFEPIVVWRITPQKFPINGQEMLFINIISSVISYVIVSLFTCRKPFNMDRMLHRGVYRHKDDSTVEVQDSQAKGLIAKIIKTFIGINSQYTRGDKILAWSVFLYSFFYRFGVFALIIGCNFIIYRWPMKWWSIYYFVEYFIVTIIIGVISTIWFFVGTTVDLKKMFHRLAQRQRNILDDGRVIGHVNADEAKMVEQIEY